MTPRLQSVNVGQPIEAEWAVGLKRTAIIKHQVSGRVNVFALGIEGDQVADTDDHGGVYQAAYAFAREDLDWWTDQIGGSRLPNGVFGENLTTEGIDVNEALVGERWRIGTTTFEIASVRIPCVIFANYLGVEGFDNSKWVKRFTAVGRPGPYLRVVEEGQIGAGDELEVVYRPDHDITVTTMFRALTTERVLLPRLLDVGDALVPDVREAVEAYAART